MIYDQYSHDLFTFEPDGTIKRKVIKDIELNGAFNGQEYDSPDDIWDLIDGKITISISNGFNVKVGNFSDKKNMSGTWKINKRPDTVFESEIDLSGEWYGVKQ